MTDYDRGYADASLNSTMMPGRNYSSEYRIGFLTRVAQNQNQPGLVRALQRLRTVGKASYDHQ